MKKLVVIITTFVLLGSVTTAALAAGDPNAGRSKSITCAACHGADGNSAVAAYPKLAGQGTDYLIKQLLEYKSGARFNPIMLGMVSTLSMQDIEDLATYFSSQHITHAESEKTLALQGKALFRGGNLHSGVAACAACHGVIGTGNDVAKFPSVAGQHSEYLEIQLKAFRAMERTNDTNQMMRSIAAKMTDTEIKAVSSYMQGLQ
jgi:cytochrome c553